LSHAAPAYFTPGAAVELTFTGQASAIKLWYRHVNQAEAWQSMLAKSDGGIWRAEIPASYTASPYPVQYYAEAWSAASTARLYPGFPDHAGAQPYIVLRRQA
jgi:hypothetical protein